MVLGTFSPRAVVRFSVIAFLVVGCASKPSPETQIDPESKKLGRASLPQDPKFLEYANEVRKKQKNEFLKSYVDYCISGDPIQGQRLAKHLKESVLKEKKKLPVENSIFHGSLGVLSSTRLMKLVSFGDPTAIEFLVIYSASVELLEPDLRSLANYNSVIKTSYNEIKKAVILKNEDFLLDYPQEI